jgi:hypothetical protein
MNIKRAPKVRWLWLLWFLAELLWFLAELLWFLAELLWFLKRSVVVPLVNTPSAGSIKRAPKVRWLWVFAVPHL